METRSTICKLAAGLLVIAGITGCGGPSADYHELGLVDISGTVTLDGVPLEGAVVMFEAPDSTFCYGTTDGNGRYKLKLNSEKTGVVPGEKLVRISTTASTGEEEALGGGEEDPDAGAEGAKEEKVPDCYHKNSNLKVTVSDPDSAFDFDLKSDCSTTGRT